MKEDIYGNKVIKEPLYTGYLKYKFKFKKNDGFFS